MIKTKAVLLLSGGLDSTTVLAIAQAQGFEVYALSFNYGQKHAAELIAATKIAKAFGVAKHLIMSIDLASFSSSSLTDLNQAIPLIENRSTKIPTTYVPARNTVMLSIALSWMESLGSKNLFYGANAIDYSNYPDCRPEYVQAFELMANLATKAGVEKTGQTIKLHTPIIAMTKAQIIHAGIALGIDYSMTVSCYQANFMGAACGVCIACGLRRDGFIAANIIDPTIYENPTTSRSSRNG